ncbi:MAG: copper chaperone PCu(A)C [Sphingomonadaceae bacterium]|nr:copper chaperone PCu(A)C [Sphingomonadaceae bacterium]
MLLVAAMVMGTVPAEAASTGPQVRDAWVRLPAVAGRPAAGYATIIAGTATRLTAVTSPQADIAIHAMDTHGGIMRMVPLTAVPIAAGQSFRFMPDGAHLMLSRLPAKALPDTTVPLTFIFADGSRVTVAARVRAAVDDAGRTATHGAH